MWDIWSSTEAEFPQSTPGLKRYQRSYWLLALKMLICVWLVTPVAIEPRKMFQKIPSVPRRTFFCPSLSLSVGERPDEAWHCTVGAYQQQQPTMTYWPGCQTDPVRTFLSGLEKNRKSLSPFAEMTKFPHTAQWIIKIPFPLNTRTSHLWLCAQQSTCEVNLSSTWVWTLCCDTALIPQSVLALAWLNLGLQEAHATWRLEMQRFLSLFL